MPCVHRVGDLRYCGAVTVERGNDDVYAGGQLIAVYDDPSSHGGGELRPPDRRVYIHGKIVACKDDDAEDDEQGHDESETRPSECISTVLIGGS